MFTGNYIFSPEKSYLRSLSSIKTSMTYTLYIELYLPNLPKHNWKSETKTTFSDSSSCSYLNTPNFNPLRFSSFRSTLITQNSFQNYLNPLMVLTNPRKESDETVGLKTPKTYRNSLTGLLEVKTGDSTATSFLEILQLQVKDKLYGEVGRKRDRL